MVLETCVKTEDKELRGESVAKKKKGHKSQ